MGLTKRRDSYYVEFPVMDDGKVLTLAQGGGGRLKRWKVGSFNKTIARQQEVLLKTDLMKGVVRSDQAKPVIFKAWGETYLQLEAVRRLHSYKDRRDTVTLQLIPFFGKKALTAITAEEVEAYRAQRRKRNGKPASVGTVNNDHIMLKHCLNMALRKGFILVNPATLVPIPNAHNERDRVLTPDEWERLYTGAARHLQPIMLTAYPLDRLDTIITGAGGSRAGVFSQSGSKVVAGRGFEVPPEWTPSEGVPSIQALRVEPAIRIERTTCGLRNRCSTN